MKLLASHFPLSMAAGLTGEVEEEAMKVLVSWLGHNVVATHPGSPCRHQQCVVGEVTAVQP